MPPTLKSAAGKPSRQPRTNGLAQNRLLAALPLEEYRRLQRSLVIVPLRYRQVLHTSTEKLTAVYFPADGVCSVIARMEDGRMAEVATVGNEGMVGVSMLLSGAPDHGETIVQVPGSFAYAMAADLFTAEMERRGPLYEIVSRYTRALFAFYLQSAACNGLHNADQRCARWLLQSQDRMGSDAFRLTREFLAVMLGVRRATVSVIAQQLQRAGLIVMERRQVKILDRPGLEEKTCECYGVIRAQFDRLLA